MTGQVASAVAIVLAAIVACVGTAYGARQARRTTTATVDVRIFELLQEDVLTLRQQLAEMRRELYLAQDESYSERLRSRRLQDHLDRISQAVQRMTRAMEAGGLTVPDDVRSILADEAGPPPPAPPAPRTP